MGAFLGAALTLVVCMGWGWAIWSANRDQPLPDLAARQHGFERAVEWLKTHEWAVLQNGNSALWWMVRVAAEQTGDPYLQSLLRRSLALTYSGVRAKSPWQRVVVPEAPYLHDAMQLDGLLAYQRFNYYAATCMTPEPADRALVALYLGENTCRPLWRRVYLTDTVCSTHQLLGLALFRRAHCAGSQRVEPLQRQMLADIKSQLFWDPIFRDPYVQRVLAVAWVEGFDQVKPVWLARVLQAQHPDGGWSGEARLLGWPDWLSPWAWRRGLSRMLPGRMAAESEQSEFHPTAQALLLVALSLPHDATRPPVVERLP